MTDKVHDGHRVRVAFGLANNRAKVTNDRLDWSELIRRLSNPVRDEQFSLEEFRKLPKKERDARKNVGYMLGGSVKDGHRKAENISERWVGALDLDAGDSSLLDKITSGNSPLAKYEFFVHSTRNHSHAEPRLRIMIPFDGSAKSEEYGPLMRILAQLIDPEGDLTDVTCFRLAQMMYLPSVCRGADFFTYRNAGSLVVPSEILDEWGDWRDYTQLPKFTKDADQLRPASKKAENPLSKRGLIGAFCRSYSIPEAIDEFIPDTYLEGVSTDGNPRYSFTGGSTTNGVIVYENGTMLYSHHATDPCGGRAINAFDMVRIHLYRELDEDSSEEAHPTSLPSHKEFCARILTDPLVKQELLQDRIDVTKVFDDLDTAVSEDGAASADPDNDNRLVDLGFDNLDDQKEDKDREWLGSLTLTPQGAISQSAQNMLLIMQNDVRMKNSVQFNEFTGEIVTRRPVRTKLSVLPTWKIRDRLNGDEWSKLHSDFIRILLEAPQGGDTPGYGLTVTDRNLETSINLTALKNSFHPVKEFLQSKKWDGKPRVETLFIDYLGAEDSDYTRTISRLTLVAAVVRIFEPGHKWDFVPILEGLQGKGKSSFIEALAVDWFAPLQVRFEDSKGVVEVLQGAWILEIPELSQFNRAERQTVKAFFSAGMEKTRLSYDKRAKKFPRQAIFLGSTNDREYLLEDKENRRFWPVFCNIDGLIDITRLKSEIAQLWAEALVLYKDLRRKQPYGRLDLSIPRDQAAYAEALLAQDSRRVESKEDVLSGVIESWLNEPVVNEDIIGEATWDDLDNTMPPKPRTRTCIMQVWINCLNGTVDTFAKASKTQKNEISRALQNIPGWSKGKQHRFPAPVGKQQAYWRTGTPIDDLL